MTNHQLTGVSQIDRQTDRQKDSWQTIDRLTVHECITVWRVIKTDKQKSNWRYSLHMFYRNILLCDIKQTSTVAYPYIQTYFWTDWCRPVVHCGGTVAAQTILWCCGMLRIYCMVYCRLWSISTVDAYTSLYRAWDTDYSIYTAHTIDKPTALALQIHTCSFYVYVFPALCNHRKSTNCLHLATTKCAGNQST